MRGAHIFLRDSQSGDLWSGGAQPFGVAAEHDEVVLSEDRAEFIYRSPSLITTMICWSPARMMARCGASL
ncbi:hypothetical protein GCM10017643_24990 [Ancylobacter dichloromethanicus]|uniref:Glycosyl hydrolase 94 supersandwich domain-containing protein n=1 Tax=Ancylobacter dichloromethanicus TaxID=518825 RepID=A0A9W6JB47_9HYPH|nr:hypothetical protein GCM10017643_24990 [Ancylobacter dichloromethanicus]